jgi:hypothetical protein
MTRVLIVNHDQDEADIEAEELRKAGYEVDQCAGPSWGGACPVMNGARCWQVDLADVLVYDEWTLADGRRDLVADIKLMHADKPLVLGPRGTRSSTRGGTTTALVDAIEEALKAGPAIPAPGLARRIDHPSFPRW